MWGSITGKEGENRLRSNYHKTEGESERHRERQRDCLRENVGYQPRTHPVEQGRETKLNKVSTRTEKMVFGPPPDSLTYLISSCLPALVP